MGALDQTDDKSRQDFHLYAQLYPMPDYVKGASENTVFEPRGLPSTAYADVQSRKFPCHTKAATYVSNVYFLEKQAELHPKLAGWIAERLRMFNHRWGIASDIKTFMQKHADVNQDGLSQLPDNAFAIVWANGQGGKARRHPLRNSGEVKQAAAWLVEYRNQLDFRTRQRIANKILDKAAEFGAALDQWEEPLEKTAGRGLYNPDEVSRMLTDRSRLAQGPDARADGGGLCKLAEAVKYNAFLAEDPATTSELCATVDQFDRKYGLVEKYSAAIPRPEDVIFAASLRIAHEFVKNACVLTTGSIYDRNQFAQLSLGDVAGVFGSELAGAVSNGILVCPEKMAELAHTLPRPDAEILDRLMSQVGQQPIRKEAQAAGVPGETREHLARAYQFLNALPSVEAAGALPPTGVTGSRVIHAN